jgi:hypothetical protein
MALNAEILVQFGMHSANCHGAACAEPLLVQKGRSQYVRVLSANGCETLLKIAKEIREQVATRIL